MSQEINGGTFLPLYRICYQKTGPAAYLSHLDLVRVMERAARRAGVPLAYSGGFNPHPKMVFASPLPVGVSGEAELADVETEREVSPGEWVEKLGACLPRGIAVRRAARVDPGPKLPALVRQADYLLKGPLEKPLTPAELTRIIEVFLKRESILVTREIKGQSRTADIRPGLAALTGQCAGGAVELHLAMAVGVRADDVLSALVKAGLPVDPAAVSVTRLAVRGDGALI